MPKVGMQPIRRQQLIEATLTAIDQVGMGDASIALIARLAGVSNGIISHYFQDKNGLIAATMRYLMNALIENVHERRRALKDDRLQRINDQRLYSNLCCQFRRVLPLPRARKAARGLAALIDGLWLRGALSGDAFDTEQAQRIAYEYMDFQLAKQVS